MSKPVYYYFLEPLNSHANEVLSKELEPSDSNENVECADRSRHDLWECSYRMFKRFMDSRLDLGIKIQGWRRRGNGQIERWPPGVRMVT
ncbi:MAG: hypothetical protein MRY49_01375 [Candidatus Pacebacteria bacterium]|nr:hypothetical protein [Candidatus Paceibacterota bacterium]